MYAKEVAKGRTGRAISADEHAKGKVFVDQVSCDFTKENRGKPDLNARAERREEYCDNCGRVMVLGAGCLGRSWPALEYNDDPPCKTIRKLSQKQQQKQTAPQPTGEDCPMCGKPLVLRQGAYGEFVSCSGYPKCKYVKQNLIEGMKCPKCGTGRHCRAQGAAREHLLGLHQLSQVRLHFEQQAGGAEVPGMRKPVPGGEDAAVGDLSGMPEQEEGRRGRGTAPGGEGRRREEGRGADESRCANRVQLLESDRRCAASADGRDARTGGGEEGREAGAAAGVESASKDLV